MGNEGLDDVIRIEGASSPQSHNVLLVSLEYPWSVGIALPRIRGDFDSKDERGRVPLDTPESEKDIAELGADAWDGLHVLIYDEGGYQAMGSSNLLTASGGSHYPGHRQEIGSERVG